MLTHCPAAFGTTATLITSTDAYERDSSLGFGQYAHVWDDFNVVGPTWQITGLYSNNYLNMTGILGVEWAIRQGITPGNGGTVVASGTEMTNFAVTFHDPGDFGFTEFTVQVFGLNVNLTSGTYWLNVTPIGSGNGGSFTSNTSGSNCIAFHGGPCGNNGNAYFESNFYGVNFEHTGSENQPDDFSMGVVGTNIPEPGTSVLLICGGGALLVAHVAGAGAKS